MSRGRSVASCSLLGRNHRMDIVSELWGIYLPADSVYTYHHTHDSLYQAKRPFYSGYMASMRRNGVCQVTREIGETVTEL
jgi:hypothetical protein